MRGIGQGQPAPALVLARRRGHPAIVDVEHRVARDQRRGVAVGPEAEMDEVEALGKLGLVARRRGVEVGVEHRHRPDALERRGGSAAWIWVRLRSGSPSGATRSSTWNTVTASPASVSASSSSSILRGVWPPLSASENDPRSASAAAAASAISSAARAAADSASSQHLDREPGTPAQLGFSSWPPNCFRIAESTLFAKSSRSRDAKRE